MDFTELEQTQAFFFEGGPVGVLVSHGFTGSPQSMRYLGEQLARQGGFTVSGPRLAGHGTTPADMAKSTAQDWIRSLTEALDALRARCDSIFITGLSMGGTLTLYLAAMYPEIVRGALPINGAVFINSPDLARLAYLPQAPENIPGIGSDIKQPGVTEMAYAVTPVAALRQLYALMGVTRDLLPRIVCPLLIFKSREDHVVPPPNGPYVLENVSSVDKQLVWLENSFHVATLDSDKDLIVRESVYFIQQHTR